MERLAEMIARVARPGRVDWIGLRPARHVEMVSVEAAQITSAGLVDDHGRSGKRAVTLVQMEHLAAIGAYLGRGPVPPEALRRNIGISGLNLLSLRGRTLALGDVELRVTGPCAPCSRMEKAFGCGGYAAVRGHGGMTAEVVRPGSLRRGVAVVPLPTET